MSLEMLVEQHHKVQYAASVQMVAQQKKNALEGTVTEVAARGEAQSVAEFIHDGEYMISEPGSRRNPENPASKSRRWIVFPEKMVSAQYIEEEEKFKTATDPTSGYVTEHVRRVLRGKQDKILGLAKGENGQMQIAHGGIFGIAREGKVPGAGTPLPSSQYVPHGNTGLTIDKLRDTLLTLRKAEFGMEEDNHLYAAIAAEQIDDLIAIAQQSAGSLNAFNIEQLRSGKEAPLMGFNWIRTNRLPFAADGETRLIPVWAKNNIILGRWQGVEGKMWNDPHAENLPYVHVSARYDCVRAQDKGVVVIECKQA